MDPRTDCIRYIGQARDAVARLKYHLSDKAKTRKAIWIRGLLKLGLRPGLEIIEETSDPDRDERFWIASLRAAGAKLVNGSDGGAVTFTAEVRAKMRQSQLGKQNGMAKSADHKAKIKASNLKTWADAAKRAEHSKINKGRKHSDESKKNFSAGQLRRYGYVVIG